MRLLLSMRVLVAISLATASPAMAQGDAAKGKLVFTQCAVCHKIDKAGGNGIGPNLYKVVGRPSGSVAGFTYSPALTKLKITWTAEKLDGFLTHPAGAVPGTRMPFAGIKDPASRQNLIAYLIAASR